MEGILFVTKWRATHVEMISTKPISVFYQKTASKSFVEDSGSGAGDAAGAASTGDGAGAGAGASYDGAATGKKPQRRAQRKGSKERGPYSFMDHQ